MDTWINVRSVRWFFRAASAGLFSSFAFALWQLARCVSSRVLDARHATD